MGHYWMLDMATGERERVRTPCEYNEVIPNSTWVACVDDGQLYLHDILTGESQALSIAEPYWYRWTANGRFLFYGHRDIDTWTESIFALDLTDYTTRTLAVDIDAEYLQTVPALSFDGQHLAAPRTVEATSPTEYSIRMFEIVSGTSELVLIGFDEPCATGDFAWSPTDNLLVYGATDILPEIGLSSKYFFLVDYATGQTRFLAEAPAEALSYGYLEMQHTWSPDGTRIAATAGSNLCVISVSDGQQDCQAVAPPGYLLRGLAWSPSGDHIAFVSNYWGSSGEIGVLNIGDQTTMTVMRNAGRQARLLWQ